MLTLKNTVEVNVRGDNRCLANTAVFVLFDLVNDGHEPENADERCKIFLSACQKKGFIKQPTWQAFRSYVQEQVRLCKEDPNIPLEIQENFTPIIRDLIADLRESNLPEFVTLQKVEKQQLTHWLQNDFNVAVARAFRIKSSAIDSDILGPVTSIRQKFQTFLDQTKEALGSDFNFKEYVTAKQQGDEKSSLIVRFESKANEIMEAWFEAEGYALFIKYTKQPYVWQGHTELCYLGLLYEISFDVYHKPYEGQIRRNDFIYGIPTPTYELVSINPDPVLQRGILKLLTTFNVIKPNHEKTDQRPGAPEEAARLAPEQLPEVATKLKPVSVIRELSLLQAKWLYEDQQKLKQMRAARASIEELSKIEGDTEQEQKGLTRLLEELASNTNLLQPILDWLTSIQRNLQNKPIAAVLNLSSSHWVYHQSKKLNAKWPLTEYNTTSRSAAASSFFPFGTWNAPSRKPERFVPPPRAYSYYAGETSDRKTETFYRAYTGAYTRTAPPPRTVPRASDAPFAQTQDSKPGLVLPRQAPKKAAEDFSAGQKVWTQIATPFFETPVVETPKASLDKAGTPPKKVSASDKVGIDIAPFELPLPAEITQPSLDKSIAPPKKVEVTDSSWVDAVLTPSEKSKPQKKSRSEHALQDGKSGHSVSVTKSETDGTALVPKPDVANVNSASLALTTTTDADAGTPNTLSLNKGFAASPQKLTRKKPDPSQFREAKAFVDLIENKEKPTDAEKQAVIDSLLTISPVPLLPEFRRAIEDREKQKTVADIIAELNRQLRYLLTHFRASKVVVWIDDLAKNTSYTTLSLFRDYSGFLLQRLDNLPALERLKWISEVSQGSGDINNILLPARFDWWAKLDTELADNLDNEEQNKIQFFNIMLMERDRALSIANNLPRTWQKFFGDQVPEEQYEESQRKLQEELERYCVIYPAVAPKPACIDDLDLTPAVLQEINTTQGGILPEMRADYPDWVQPALLEDLKPALSSVESVKQTLEALAIRFRFYLRAILTHSHFKKQLEQLYCKRQEDLERLLLLCRGDEELETKMFDLMLNEPRYQQADMNVFMLVKDLLNKTKAHLAHLLQNPGIIKLLLFDEITYKKLHNNDVMALQEHVRQSEPLLADLRQLLSSAKDFSYLKCLSDYLRAQFVKLLLTQSRIPLTEDEYIKLSELHFVTFVDFKPKFFGTECTPPSKYVGLSLEHARFALLNGTILRQLKTECRKISEETQRDEKTSAGFESPIKLRAAFNPVDRLYSACKNDLECCNLLNQTRLYLFLTPDRNFGTYSTHLAQRGYSHVLSALRDNHRRGKYIQSNFLYDYTLPLPTRQRNLTTLRRLRNSSDFSACAPCSSQDELHNLIENTQGNSVQTRQTLQWMLNDKSFTSRNGPDIFKFMSVVLSRKTNPEQSTAEKRAIIATRDALRQNSVVVAETLARASKRLTAEELVKLAELDPTEETAKKLIPSTPRRVVQFLLGWLGYWHPSTAFHRANLITLIEVEALVKCKQSHISNKDMVQTGILITRILKNKAHFAKVLAEDESFRKYVAESVGGMVTELGAIPTTVKHGTLSATELLWLDYVPLLVDFYQQISISNLPPDLQCIAEGHKDIFVETLAQLQTFGETSAAKALQEPKVKNFVEKNLTDSMVIRLYTIFGDDKTNPFAPKLLKDNFKAIKECKNAVFLINLFLTLEETFSSLYMAFDDTTVLAAMLAMPNLDSLSESERVEPMEDFMSSFQKMLAKPLFWNLIEKHPTALLSLVDTKLWQAMFKRSEAVTFLTTKIADSRVLIRLYLHYETCHPGEENPFEKRLLQDSGKIIKECDDANLLLVLFLKVTTSAPFMAIFQEPVLDTMLTTTDIKRLKQLLIQPEFIEKMAEHQGLLTNNFSKLAPIVLKDGELADACIALLVEVLSKTKNEKLIPALITSNPTSLSLLEKVAAKLPDREPSDGAFKTNMQRVLAEFKKSISAGIPSRLVAGLAPKPMPTDRLSSPAPVSSMS